MFVISGCSIYHITCSEHTRQKNMSLVSSRNTTMLIVQVSKQQLLADQSWNLLDSRHFCIQTTKGHNYRRTIFFWHWIFNILSFNFARWASGRLIILWTPDTKDKMPVNKQQLLKSKHLHPQNQNSHWFKMA